MRYIATIWVSVIVLVSIFSFIWIEAGTTPKEKNNNVIHTEEPKGSLPISTELVSPSLSMDRQVTEPPSLAIESVPDFDLIEEVDALHSQALAMRKRIQWLETELALCGSTVTTGTLGDWLGLLLPEERPDRPTLLALADVLQPYEGIRLSPAEGLWILDRIKLRDWKDHGPTADEAVILFLGPSRIIGEVPLEQGKQLREEYSEEMYFSR